jgi:HPt (histidine-containing phosphotransfer) domain-containing protein
MSPFEERMAKLKLRYAARLDAEKLLLEQALASGDRAEVRRLAHGLSGSGAVFGYPDLSEAGRSLEAAVDKGEALQEPADFLLKLMAVALLEASGGA